MAVVVGGIVGSSAWCADLLLATLPKQVPGEAQNVMRSLMVLPRHWIEGLADAASADSRGRVPPLCASKVAPTPDRYPVFLKLKAREGSNSLPMMPWLFEE